MADVIFPGATPTDTLGATRLPNNVDMEFWRGDAQTYVLALTAADASPIDLSGYTAKASIRASFTAPTKYAWACTVQNGNEVKLYLSSDVSKTIPAGSYVWDFKLVEVATGDARTYLAGDVIVYDEVTD